jgi:hypothetical protein
LFTLITDALHEGFKIEDGYTMNDKAKEPITVTSIGYADDTTIVSNTWGGLKRSHEWLLEFYQAHHFKLNNKKSHLIIAEGMKKNTEMQTKRKLACHEEDAFIEEEEKDFTWRHLGIFINMQLDWRRQQQKMQGSIMGIISKINLNRLHLIAAATAVREHLIPKLDIGLQFCKIPLKILKTWDSYIRRAVVRTMNTDLGSNICCEALRLAANIPSLQNQYAIIRSSELYITLNAKNDPNTELCWQRGIDTYNINVRDGKYKKLIESIDLQLGSVKKLEIRETNWFKNTVALLQKSGVRLMYNDNAWKHGDITVTTTSDSWINSIPARHNAYANPNMLTRIELQENKTHLMGVTAFTDGSTSRSGKPNSGFGIVLKQDQRSKDLDGIFKTSGNNFLAELIAIQMTMMTVPVNTHLNIYTDSKAAKYAIEKVHPSERSMLHTAARPLIRSIQHIRQQREREGCNTNITWMRAHTEGSSYEQKANKQADWVANNARREAETMDSLPNYLWNEEQVIFIINNTHIIGDVRKEVKRQFVHKEIQDWTRHKHQGKLITDMGTDVINLFQLVRTWNNSEALAIVLQSVTRWWPTDCLRAKRGIKTDQSVAPTITQDDIHVCIFCSESNEQIGDIDHLLNCSELNRRTATALEVVYGAFDPTRIWDRRVWQEKKRLTQIIKDNVLMSESEAIAVLAKMMHEDAIPLMTKDNILRKKRHIDNYLTEEENNRRIRAGLLPQWFDQHTAATKYWCIIWKTKYLQQNTKEAIEKLIERDKMAGGVGLIPSEAEEVVREMVIQEDKSWLREGCQAEVYAEVNKRLLHIREAIVHLLITKHQMWKVRNKVVDKKRDEQLRQEKTRQKAHIMLQRIQELQKKKAQKAASKVRGRNKAAQKNITRIQLPLPGTKRKRNSSRSDRNWNKKTKLGQRRVKRLRCTR